MKPNITLWPLSLSMLIGLPLAGLIFEDKHIPAYLEFPPLTRYVSHAPFSPWAFAMICTVDLLMVCGVAFLLRHARRRARQTPLLQKDRGTFPAWGWLGIAVMTTGWVLAWTRFPWFAKFQSHTFCLPWVGYILVVNALSVWKSKRSLWTDRPGAFLALWPTSALFWWFFEYLNRFVQNWYYVGADLFSVPEYIFHASLAFATVLPAVLSTCYFLLTFRLFDAGLKSIVAISWLDSKRTAGLILAIAAIGLTLIGRFPDYLYPLVWGAPLLVFTSLQTLWNKPNLFSGLKQGDWRTIIASAIAALICGFLWELWNYHSLARWEYAIPFVNRFHIFEMPLLGYGGYLPFGLECLLVGQMVIGSRALALPAASRDD